ncbi:MAG: HAMP domain-containing sensor histidine kinase [Candidatus Paceibacterota bacterium]|nr:MAG: HAMP domain-containing sensor histidine kinase [Candidatus Paceibacterota bacterium]
MAIRLIHSNKFESNKWLISARWFYAPAIFVMGLLSRLDPVGDAVFPLPVMLLLFSIFILVNAVFWLTAKQLEMKNQTKRINYLGFGQIMAELVFFLFIFHFSGGIESISSIFFFIPIVSSIILFSPIGSLFVAFVSAVLVNGMIFLSYFGIAQKIYGYSGREIVEYDELLVMLSTSIVISAVYFIVGSLSGYLSSALKKREYQIIEGRRQAELQSEKLRLLNEEYNKFARRLIRQDLELKKETEEVERLDQEKREFVSTVAHQLRTPLSAIKWTLDTLLRGNEGVLTSDQRALIMKAYESNERIISLIHDMLGSERIDAGAGGFSPVEINLTDLLDNVLPDFHSVIENKNIKIEIQKEKNLPKVKVDPQKIRAVFQNLIENAVKYSKKGGKITIALSLNKVGDKVLALISDEGIGIPKEEQSNLFRKFFRASNAVKLEPGGTGLGLFIVKSLIEQHGGSINFESQDGKGTKFILEIPISPVPPAQKVVK